MHPLRKKWIEYGAFVCIMAIFLVGIFSLAMGVGGNINSICVTAIILFLVMRIL